MKMHRKIQDLQNIWTIIQVIYLLGKVFPRPHQLDPLGKTGKHQ